jgi:BirA family biotin operon repressor/biotin-[acetyl-CoA-carboxylase] ligase
LYLSVLLRPPANTENISLISLLAAIAVAETLAQYHAAAIDIKWPNDVLINERKVCGILVEGVSNGALRLIAGIGVNLNQQSFPPAISETATSLALHVGAPIVVAEFRERLLERLAHWYAQWRLDASSIVTRWRGLSSYAQGQHVAVTLDDEIVLGETAGITADGSLLVRMYDGTLRAILAGDVAKLRKAP